MSRMQKIIIGFVAVLFGGGITTAFWFAARHPEVAPVQNVVQMESPTVETQTTATLPDTPDRSGADQPAPVARVAAPEPATVSSKADAERMLQEMENEFQSIDADTSAQ